MKTSKIFCLIIIALNLQVLSCSSDRIKEKINKTGDVAGQAIGEFTSGVTSGVEKSIEPKVVLSEKLKSSGLSFGKIIVSGDSADLENVLTVYIIFNNDFNGSFLVKAFDNKKREMGRVKTDVKGKKDEARYVEFHFDQRTNIDNDSELTIE